MALRKTRALPPIWIDDMQVYLAESEHNVEDRRRVGWPAFEALIAEAEGVVRKEMGRETPVEEGLKIA